MHSTISVTKLYFIVREIDIFLTLEKQMSHDIYVQMKGRYNFFFIIKMFLVSIYKVKFM